MQEIIVVEKENGTISFAVMLQDLTSCMRHQSVVIKPHTVGYANVAVALC